MSVCPSPITCGGELTLDQLIASLFLVDSNGCVYLNARQTVITAENCDEYSPAVSCGGEITLKQLFLRALTTDECGNVTLNMISQETT